MESLLTTVIDDDIVNDGLGVHFEFVERFVARIARFDLHGAQIHLVV